MKKVNVNEASGPVLDWMVAKCESRIGVHTKYLGGAVFDDLCEEWLRYSTDWSQGGPVIEREGITLRCGLHGWDAELEEFDAISHGPTALIAAMRCYVASKLGEGVEVPDELLCRCHTGPEWDGSPNPANPDNEWVCDDCGRVIKAEAP